MRARSGGQSALLLLDVIDILKVHNIRYAVVGAFAVSFYGVVRASIDADAVISLTQTDMTVDKFKGILEKSGFKAVVRRADAHDPLRGLIIVEDKLGNQVDLILGIRGMDNDVYKRIKKTVFKMEALNVIGLEDLISMKLFAGGNKDMNDVIGILEVSKKEVDFSLLRKLTKNYGQEALKRLEQFIK